MYDQTGIKPFPVEHQGQMTPLQLRTIAEGTKAINEKKRERMEEAKSGSSSPTSSASGASSRRERVMKAQAERAHGAQSKSFTNQDWDPDKPLVMDEDEVMHPVDH